MLSSEDATSESEPDRNASELQEHKSLCLLVRAYNMSLNGDNVKVRESPQGTKIPFNHHVSLGEDYGHLPPGGILFRMIRRKSTLSLIVVPSSLSRLFL